MTKQYSEVVFEGPYSNIRGFIDGFIAGSGKEFAYFFSDNAGVKAETMSEVLKEWISLSNKIHHVVMESDLLDKIKKSLEKSVDSDSLNKASIKSAKAIKSASFRFKFNTYGRKYGDDIKKLLEKLPGGLSLKEYAPVEKVDKDARGVELYSPAHEYSFEGTGVIAGPVDEAIAFRKVLDDHPLVDVAVINLEF
ncbi:MAG: hypothetical protein MUC76_10040 [Spirochaetes bacterium]|jgi:hypothetical protein|nr:hypothetical protein [Spirochaetota bacterium]